MGINGYQYINDSIDCMICSNECTSSTCDNGPRILPWTQDYDDGINCQGENQGLCEADDDDSDECTQSQHRGVDSAAEQSFDECAYDLCLRCFECVVAGRVVW